jgi:hypothetical protein
MSNTIKVNNVETPIRFSMRAIALYFESKGKSLSDLGGLTFTEIQDVYWLAVKEGCRYFKAENPFADENEFFDSLDDDPGAMEKLGNAMNYAFGGDDTKNAKPQVKQKV